MNKNKYNIKLFFKWTLSLPIYILDFFQNLYGNSIYAVYPNFWLRHLENKQSYIKSRLRNIEHLSDGEVVRFKIYTPNRMCEFRAVTFSNKEPETLAWIDEFGGAGAFWDIGANIGIYSLYYATHKRCSVFAFEPSVFNLELLARNIDLNHLSNLITIVPTPVTNTVGVSSFRLSSLEEGGALSTFGVDFGHDGQKLNSVLSYQTVGFSLDSLFESGSLTEVPSLIKIDVDGIEHLVLAGAKNLLRSPRIKSILIEVTDDFEEQSRNVKSSLESAGFTLRNSEMSEIRARSRFAGTRNQIWVRS